MKKLMMLLSALILVGCGTLELAGKPAVSFKPPTDKDGSPAPMVKIQQFGNVYQMPPTPAVEQPAAALTPSAPPQAKAVISPYEVHKSKWSDPRLTVFCNNNQFSESMRILVAGLEIKLVANRCSDDLPLAFGQHLVRVIVERGIAPNVFEVERQPFQVITRKDGQAQVVNLY